MPMMRFALLLCFALAAWQVEASPSEAVLTRLWKWAAEVGVQVHPAVHWGPSRYGGMGMFVTEDIANETILINSSYSAMIYQSRIFSDEFDLAEKLPEDMHLADRVGIFMLQQRVLGEASPFAPYFDCLPTEDELHTPIFWSDEELAELQNSQLRAFVEKRRRAFAWHYSQVAPVAMETWPDLFNETTFSLDAWYWALTITWSRNFAIKPPPTYEKEANAHIPVADLFNTAPQKEINLFYGIDPGNRDYFTFMTVKPLKAGDEIFISYGYEACYLDLLGYGFCLEDEEDRLGNLRDGAHIRVTLPRNDRFYAEKKRMMEDLNLWGWQEDILIAHHGHIAESVMPLIRILVMRRDEFHRYKAVADGPIGKRNEMAAVSYLLGAARRQLRGYATSLKEDEALWEERESMPFTHRSALNLRMREKRILTRMIRNLQGLKKDIVKYMK
eukprot:PLAT11237.2.p1 GENE.PLAT11237.2~~PLAT11237.2.p1  ORF type:complete len:444 (-),score=207.29 PLAT11237.2:112-1443(-)